MSNKELSRISNFEIAYFLFNFCSICMYVDIWTISYVYLRPLWLSALRMYHAFLSKCMLCMCGVQVYGGGVESLCVTSVIDCVGILSKHPHLARFEGEKEEGEEMMGETAAERSAHCPPPSLVPRLHCIMVTTPTHCNPLLPDSLPRPLPGEGSVKIHTF